MFVKRQLTAAVLSGIMVLALASPALADYGQNFGRGDSVDRGNVNDQSNARQLLAPEKKASEELNNLEQRVNSDTSRDLQDGNYSQVKTALNDYLASIDEIESAGGAEQTVNGDWQQLRSDQESGNTAAVQTDETTLQADVNTAVTVIQTASTGLETVIQDLKGPTTGNPGTTQTATPTITGTPTAGNTSVSGTSTTGASIVLTLNNVTVQPPVIADPTTGIWTVNGLTLQSGDIISVTAQVTGDTVSNAATATVAAAAQTVTPTIIETPNSGYTSGWSRNGRQW
jgi:TolA-binding protein